MKDLSQTPETSIQEMVQPKIDNDPLEPVVREEKQINPAITNKTELEDNLNESFKSLAGAVGDIESYKEGGRFRSFVFGINTKLKNHPIIKKCPWEFRHMDMERTVADGAGQANQGWTVLSKALIKGSKKDPKTGKDWFTVARDDTPNADYYSVGKRVLCYCKKEQYIAKQSKRNINDMYRTAKMADKRQESAMSIAAMSKRDPAASIQGYKDANTNDNKNFIEQLKHTNKYSSQEAQKFIDDIDNIDATSRNIESNVKMARDMASNGQISQTARSSPLRIDAIK